MSVVFKALSDTYGQLAQWRVKAYQQEWLSQHKVNIPVISVGNLTVGGTGKTPISGFLLQMFLEKGFKPAVVSRSYRASRRGIQKIDPKNDKAQEVGDESLMLAQKFSDVPVYSGTKKWQVAKELAKNEKSHLILLDDGFQHLQLYRNLDILLFDASEQEKNYQCLPEGRAREPLSALERADLFFLTKCNQASSENLKFHRNLLQGKDVYEFDYQISAFQSLFGSETMRGAPQRVLLVTGLAKSKSFVDLVKAQWPSTEIELIEFSDHHAYSDQDMQRIERARAKGHFEFIITSEKDAVKLKQIKASKSLPIWVAFLKLQPKFSTESLYEKISTFLT